MPYDYWSAITGQPSEPLTEPSEEDFLNFLPNVIKEGYNRSITGLADQILTGKKRFDLSQYDPSVLEDIGATIVSFFMPADIATFWAGGGIGGTLVKKLIGSGVAKATAEKVAVKALAQAKIRALAGGTQLAFYSGLHEGVKQQAEEGKVKLEDVFKAGLRGGALGGAIGGVGGVLAGAGKGLAYQVPAEIGTFATVGALTEGRLPTTPEDWIHSAGMVLGLKTVGGALKLPAKLKEARAKELGVTPEQAEAIAKLQVEQQILGEEPIWYSQRGKYRAIKTIGKPYFSESGKTKMMPVMDAKTGKKFSMPVDRFFRDYTKLSKIPIAPAEIVTKLRQVPHKIALGENRLNLTPEEFMQRKKEVAGVEKDISTTEMTNEQLQKLTDNLVKEEAVKNLKQTFLKNIPEIPKDGIVSRWMRQYMPSIMQAGKRISHIQEGQILNGLINNAQTLERNRMGEAIFKGQEAGLLRKVRFKDTKENIARAEAVNDAMLGNTTGKSKEVLQITSQTRKAYDWMWQTGKRIYDANNVKRQPYRKNYTRGMIKEDVLKTIFDDIAKLAKADPKLEALLMEKGIKDVDGTLNNIIERAQSLEFQDPTKRALAMIKAQNPKLTTFEAYKQLTEHIVSELYIPFSAFEKPKILKLPPEYYEKDARILFARYATQWARRLAFIENFGGRGERGNALVRMIHNQDPKAGKVATDLMAMASGTVEIDPKYNFRNPKTKNLIQDWMSFQVATKIALGFATIPNVTQSLMSTMRDVGYWRFFRSSLRLATDKNLQKLLKESGSTIYNPSEVILGVAPSEATKMGRVASVLSYFSGFTGINKINSMLAAVSAHDFVLSLQKIASGKGVFAGLSKARRNWAISRLRDFGVLDHTKKLSDVELKRIMFQFARDTQLQKNILKDMLAANNPMMRPFFIFKRFGLRQFLHAKDEVVKELRRGNVMVPLRLAAAGMIGAPFVFWARNMLKSAMGGEKVYREDDEMWMRFIDDFAAVGALGFVSDIFSAPTSFVGAAEFFVTPVVLSDVQKVWNIGRAFERDVESFGLGVPAFQRAFVRSSQLAGGLARATSKRLETIGLKERRLSQQKGKVRARILDLLAEGKTSLAISRVKQWNNAHPEAPFTWNDIGYDSVYRRLAQKRRIKLKP